MLALIVAVICYFSAILCMMTELVYAKIFWND